MRLDPRRIILLAVVHKFVDGKKTPLSVNHRQRCSYISGAFPLQLS